MWKAIPPIHEDVETLKQRFTAATAGLDGLLQVYSSRRFRVFGLEDRHLI